MNHYAFCHIARERVADRHREAERHRLARTIRRRRRRPAENISPLRRTGDLGVDLATLGFPAVEPDIAQLARQAQRSGVSPALVEVLTDRWAPEVLRQRAFARIVAALQGDLPQHHDEEAPCEAA